LKGYLSNTTLTKNEIIENYGHLWKIEKAVRISKNDLKIRPIYHRLQRRISVQVKLNESDETVSKTIYTRAEQKNLADLFGL